MYRYFLKLSFNGSRFHGWQIQENANSIQAELNKALAILLKQNIETAGCGRTDTGVHAKMFFAHFDTGSIIENEKDFIFHLNCLLPLEIAVQNIIPVTNDAHARHDATSRTYQYFIHQQKNPFLNDSSFFIPYKADMNLMNEASALLLRYHDFKCFSKSRTQVKTTICNITSAQWNVAHDQLKFEITANRFLRNMVRAIVGTLLEVGKCRISTDDFKQIIENGNRSNAGMSVPAHALFLTDIKYPFINS